jgi:hypothetical protein
MIVGTHYQRAGAGFALALLALFQPGVAWSQGTVKHDHFLQSSTEPDLKIHVRERLPAVPIRPRSGRRCCSSTAPPKAATPSTWSSRVTTG